MLDIRVREGPANAAEVWIAMALAVLATLALGFTAWAARDFLMPVAVAMVFAIMLSPITRLFERAGMPPAVSSLVVTLGLIAAVVGTGWALIPDVSNFSEDLPKTVRAIERKARDFQEAVRPLSQASDRLQSVGERISGGPGPDQVVIQRASPLTIAMNTVSHFLAQAAFSVVLIYFMLAQRRMLKSVAIHMAKNHTTRRKLMVMFTDIKWRVSRYLLTITLINIALGVLSTLILSLLGFPNAPLWGAAMVVLNFIPYVGPLVIQAAALLVGLVYYDTVSAALLPVVSLWALNTLEGQLVTPWLVGRGLVLNPLAVFLAIGFGGWVWGITGAIVAVPALIVATSALQHWWNPLRRDDDEERVDLSDFGEPPPLHARAWTGFTNTGFAPRGD